MFSLQTVRLYEKICVEKNKDHAAALFLILLPKVEKNPNGYICAAYNRGAEPDKFSLDKIKQMHTSE